MKIEIPSLYCPLCGAGVKVEITGMQESPYCTLHRVGIFCDCVTGESQPIVLARGETEEEAINTAIEKWESLFSIADVRNYHDLSQGQTTLLGALRRYLNLSLSIIKAVSPEEFCSEAMQIAINDISSARIELKAIVGRISSSIDSAEEAE